MKNLLLLFLVLVTLSAGAQSPGKRKLRPSDVYRLKSINDAHISPDGKWVCYTLSSVDSAKDQRNSNLSRW